MMVHGAGQGGVAFTAWAGAAPAARHWHGPCFEMVMTRKLLTACATALAADGGGVKAAPALNAGDTAWMLTATMLVILMILPGLALFYGGLVRSKNMLSVLAQVFVIFSLITVLWVVYGFTLAFGGAGAFFGGFGKLFLLGITPDTLSPALPTIPEYVFVAFESAFAAITVSLIVGAFAERIKFAAVVMFSVLWFSFSYVPLRTWCGAAACWPETAHWTLPAAPWCTSMPPSPAWWAPTCWAGASASAAKRCRRTA